MQAAVTWSLELKDAVRSVKSYNFNLPSCQRNYYLSKISIKEEQALIKIFAENKKNNFDGIAYQMWS